MSSAPGTRAVRRRRRWRRRINVFTQRTVLFGIGGTLVVAGLFAVPTPVPGLGLALFAGGLYFLARGSKSARRAVTWSRRRVPAFSSGLRRMQPHMPHSVRRFIENSDPGKR